MNNTKIGTIEAIMIPLNIVIVHCILSIPKTLISNTKTSTILNIIYVTVLALLFVLLVCKFFKKFPGMDILDISQFLGNKTLKNVLGTIFILYFIISSSIFLRNFCECLKIVYYPSTNIIFIIVMFVIASTIANHFDFNASLKANLIIIPTILISIIFLFTSNIEHYTFQRVFPILGDGFFQTFITGIGNIFSFSGIVYLYFLPPLLKEPEKFKKIAISTIIISSIFIILSIAIILFLFTLYYSTDEILPLYIAATYIEFGTFFQRLESIFLLIWMLTFACYLCIVNKFSLYILKKLTNIKSNKVLIYPLSLITFAIAILPKNFAISKFYESNIYPYLSIGLVFIICFFILGMAYLKKKKVGEENV